MRPAINLYSLARKFPTEKHALEHLIRTRWPKGVLRQGSVHLLWGERMVDTYRGWDHIWSAYTENRFTASH